MRNPLVAAAMASLALAPGLASAAPPEAPSLVDQFTAGRACRVHADNPDIVWLETIGSVDGVRPEKLSDELMVVLTTLQKMMEETGSRREDMLELRVTTTSDAYRREVAQMVARIPELDGLPFSYRVVDGFSVKWARVGLDAVLRNPQAGATITAKYGSNPGPACGI